ncbi:FG-GAP repeat domain-containing protein [Marinithermus hydrothermalis]|uniref:FG-GAP repeat protein n=1 Tax=Marinithermus hydrothermalis (strain DSM 14884 / JCM 11576 / T1) TaxID=869210 RepID=F2NM23_MARHT|nr:VCBS repeat-containing protein [Marinithermus hydrothermalis]AEB11493.1 FG-GAP repeat protein [Marinithermus hydrothermalis DSM 14884]
MCTRLGRILALTLIGFVAAQTHAPLPLDQWAYIQVDRTREVFQGNVRYLGLAMGDVNGDGYADIVSGRYAYRNPGGDLTGPWARIAFPENVDAMLLVDVDEDGRLDAIAQALPGVYWVRPEDAQGERWSVRQVATLEPTEHINSQGYTLAQLEPGGLPEIAFTTGAGLWYLRIPERPEAGTWPKVRVSAEAVAEDLLAAGDLDGDGDDDLIATLGPAVGGRAVHWWENPGDGSADWPRYLIGTTENPGDRAAVADVNGDGRLDVIVSEENGKPEGAYTFWFEQPADPRTAPWPRHTVAVQGSTNSMSVADMDRDGDPDIITAEHRGALRVVIWENRDHGTRWVPHPVDAGKESHLGARVADLDADGDLEIISIGWDAPQYLHLWRNDAIP